ncbi:CaiB/BaiF CoA transferase family protein [Pueribacillus theae]|uniref:CaiB/BaiF CoA transferase family protein n=1 Tax=Pueribacillus theae TaxID=2171751 RepID=UPI001F0C4BCF|nr:CaiB/BaiF CoA-transferase family protein [Pueribacillus theae]
MAGPLQGIRVIDVTTNVSGPSLTMILADLGAEVIKIEKPDIGDDSRMMGPLWKGEGVYYLNINRNKRSIVINIRSEEGKKLVYDFVKDADVFVENFRFGKAEKMGFGYQDLQEINPALIYCSLSAYGQEGIKRYKPGYDAIVQADTGIMGINGSEDEGVARVAVSILDQGSAMWGAIGIISALYHRLKTGEGQKVETSLYETGIFWMGYHMLAYMATGEEPVKLGSNHASFAPYGAYETADNPVMIGVSNNSLFEKVCKVIGKEEWIEDKRFKTNLDRVKNRKELNHLIEKILKTKRSEYWITKFEETGVPSSMIQPVSAIMTNEQTESINMLTEIQHRKINDLKIPRLPFQLSKTSLEIKKAPPLLGEDTEAILKERGVNQETIDELIEKGIIQKND